MLISAKGKQMFNIHKVNKNNIEIVKSKEFDLYSYTVYTGKQDIVIDKGDSAWLVNNTIAKVERGGQTISNEAMCVVIRGYQCEVKTSSFHSISNLPYVNGCSSHQVFPPVRPGDPTMQLLYLPPNTMEQAHHIHSTVRVVYVLRGKGWSVQGMKGEYEMALNEGDVIILDKMTPHHFRTEENELVVIPVHIFSSTLLETKHPMKDGTFII